MKTPMRPGAFHTSIGGNGDRDNVRVRHEWE